MLELAKLIDLIVGFASPVVQNKLQRSELVIKLLKQLNLDPDHPPADFTAVYQYTLVEYGIGKPKPVLEMFRQAEIQAIFRKALEQNNPSLLLKNGETFLAGHSLGDQIQAGNAIDLLFLARESVGIEESPQPIPTHGFRTRSLPRL